MKKMLLTCFIVLFGVSLCTAAEKKVELKIDVRDNKPKFMISQDGSVTGMMVDMMKLIESKTNIKFVYNSKTATNVTRADKNIQNGTTDILFGANKTPERENYVIFGESLYYAQITTVMRKNETQDFKSLEDLKKLGQNGIVLTVAGSTMAQMLKGVGLNVDEGANTVEGNLEKLIAGRGRVVIYTNIAMNYIISEMGYRENKVKFAEMDFKATPEFQGAPQYVLYSKALPKDIINTINNVIINAKKTGEWKKIIDKYL